jgi:O-antigen ligase
MAKEKPVLGYGAGSFAKTSKKFGGVPGWKIIVTPHNEYCMMLVEFGCVGLISLLLLFLLQWRISFCLGDMQNFAQGLLLVFMVSSIYNAFLYLSVSGHFYVLFTSLFFAQYRYGQKVFYGLGRARTGSFCGDGESILK